MSTSNNFFSGQSAQEVPSSSSNSFSGSRNSVAQSVASNATTLIVKKKVKPVVEAVVGTDQTSSSAATNSVVTSNVPHTADNTHHAKSAVASPSSSSLKRSRDSIGIATEENIENDSKKQLLQQ
jgi:hypothetical protein